MKKIGLMMGWMALVAVVTGLRADETPDYTKGIFILNEDWFGHQNSTINYLRPDGEWEYRVFQKENPGMELGCTSQFGAIYNGRMYIISKQERDKGAAVTGGRITVCDAKTMKCLAQIADIATDSTGASIADGRGFVGVNPAKGYVSTSNGIYVLNLEDLRVDGMIPGTGSDGGGLYSAQCGMMLRCGGYVLAVHQKKGLLVIDAESDTVVRIIGAPVDEVDGKRQQRGYGSIVQSKDSSLWLSVAADLSGRGTTVDYFFRLDPQTLDTVRVDVPTGYGLPNSWYAWTADAFCASSQQNRLYWKKQGGGWFTNHGIVGYDIDKGTCFDFFDTYNTLDWYMYCGAGFRLHPQTDEMYVSLYQDNLKQTYATLRLDHTGEVQALYEMIDNYWFPAMVIFPESASGPGGPGEPDDPVVPGDTVSKEALDCMKVVLYPNPGRETVYIQGAYAVLRIYDMAGRLLRVFDALPQVPTGDLMPGTYFFHLSDAQGRRVVHKIMIQ